MRLTFLRQRGLGLVELMVGITVGLIVAAAASMVAVNQINEHRRLMLETQVQQDLRASADLIQQGLRRAGYRTIPLNSVWAPPAMMGTLRQRDAVVATANAFTDMVKTSDEDEVSLTYLAGTYGEAVSDTPRDKEHFGVKWDRRQQSLKVQIGAGNWQPITDPETLLITDFDIDIETEAVDLPDFCDRPCNPPAAGAPACPKHEVRRIRFTLVGEAAHDRNVKRTLSGVERMRNDVVTGACPA